MSAMMRTVFNTPSFSSRVRPKTGNVLTNSLISSQHHLCGQQHVYGPLASQARGIQYLWRRGFWPWKQDYAKRKRRETIKKRNILPRTIDPNEDAIFDPKLQLDWHTFKIAPVRQSVRRLMDYQRLMKGRQIDDAIDAVEALARPSADPILNVLNRGKRHLVDRGMDPARLFIKTAWVRFLHYTKQIRRHAKGGYGWAKTPHCRFYIGVREMPLPEFFHRTYVQGRTPRSIGMDMRLALMSKKAPREMEKEWAPYLTSQSRCEHRRSLKWRHATRDFDYYAEVLFL